ncbi:aminoglycoside phosphotransferase family protein [Mycolicibacterium porcinum]|uniref:Phosphotransferase n=1 Tax=Mycolicibacterium porcinum TaxID=39693 RepID=A0AAW5SXT8_9MYCO|nr:aminoglycoside phosphotransferase family protein [Mycolicibacterium porcinum]MCV7387437.1 phosphotransferase [Mycolicibacterium porcinum]ORB33768.1 aminoglycoside resistance protein [Mycolicibacterium porcinum]TVX94988.1 phosphotransferase [Mycolicibacterium porcinum]
MIDLPEAVRAMGTRGPRWQSWVDGLPRLIRDQLDEWELRADGPAFHGYCSIVLPVRTRERRPAVLKAAFPDDESEHEHLALRRWAGSGAVRLMRADPHRRMMLLERLQQRNLNEMWDIEACEIVAGLYEQLHVPALPQLRSLAECTARWTADLTGLPRSAPVPRRLVEQAITLGQDLAGDPATTGTLIHGDLHYENVLAADREPWLVIDPKPMNGDPHYEVAPMLWNRWEELAGYVRDGVRRRLSALVDAAGLDADRARAWVIVRMLQNAMWELTETAEPDATWLTTCVAIAKAVQD